MPDFSDDAIADIRRELLRWYDEEHRPLPWRQRPSEYKTVVSEIMLQQTQVAAVVPFFNAFVKKFPSFAALAEAPEEEVLKAWSGLGYYRRARSLKRAAEIVVREHGGRLPADPKLLRELPGFGEYTVGAVASIALGLRMPLVDGNVRRVFSRLAALGGDLAKSPGKDKLWALCETLVDPDRPGDFNQGLMELGATVCRPQEPLCLVCPLFDHCRARQAGRADAYPQPLARQRLEKVREVAVALMRGDKFLVLQRGEEQSFAGMWELPRMDSRQVLEPEALTPERVVFDLARIRPGRAELVGAADSTFTHHKITTELYRAKAMGSQRIRRQRHVAHKWVKFEELAELPSSKAQKRLYALLEAGE